MELDARDDGAVHGHNSDVVRSLVLGYVEDFLPSGVHAGSIRYSVSSSRTKKGVLPGARPRTYRPRCSNARRPPSGETAGWNPLRDLRVRLRLQIVSEDPPTARPRAREEQALAVTTPRRLDIDGRMRRDGLFRPAVGADGADLEIAGGLEGKRDPRSVRAPGRLEVIRRPGRDRDRFAAAGRDLPDIAPHREGDPGAIRTPRRIERPRRDRWHQVTLFAIAVAVAIRPRSADDRHRQRGDRRP